MSIAFPRQFYPAEGGRAQDAGGPPYGWMVSLPYSGAAVFFNSLQIEATRQDSRAGGKPL